jgi:hypothetical protein
MDDIRKSFEGKTATQSVRGNCQHRKPSLMSVSPAPPPPSFSPLLVIHKEAAWRRVRKIFAPALVVAISIGKKKKKKKKQKQKTEKQKTATTTTATTTTTTMMATMREGRFGQALSMLPHEC